MHPEAGSLSNVIFGWHPLWVSTILFIATYIAIVSEKINRAIAAGLGAGLMIMLGVLNQQQAIDGIDFNTLGLLTGMMVIVGITRRCGIFQYIAIWSAKKVNARPWGILVMLSIVTAVFSALLDNVTTVLLIAPVTLLITEELKINPYPYLFAEIFASNIGGTATLIGDPPNIMIGSAVGLSFNDFLLNTAPITPVIMLITLLVIYFVWGRGLITTDDARQRVMRFNEQNSITDPRLLKQSLLVLGLVIIGFTFAHHLNVEPATVALFGASLLLLLNNYKEDADDQTEDVQKSYSQVEWVTIFFFAGLFVVVSGIEHSGLLKMLGEWIIQLTGGDMTVTSIAILWVSSITSALVDNIPFVATMIPLIESMAPTFGDSENLMPLWWSLALGACLGGNGSLIGASANLIVASYAERAGHRIAFIPFMLMAFPLMLLSIVISTLYIYLRYL